MYYCPRPRDCGLRGAVQCFQRMYSVDVTQSSIKENRKSEQVYSAVMSIATNWQVDAPSRITHVMRISKSNGKLLGDKHIIILPHK